MGALSVAREAHQAIGFDAVQHLTFGVFRQPSRMGELGIPFVHGPVGGGEETPRGLRAVFPWRARQIERLRELAQHSKQFGLVAVFEDTVDDVERERRIATVQFRHCVVMGSASH